MGIWNCWKNNCNERKGKDGNDGKGKDKDDDD